MIKKLFTLANLFVLTLFFSINSYGQNTYTVHYCSQCVSNGLCKDRQFSTCEEAEASGRLSCPGGGWYITPKCGSSPDPSPGPAWSKSPVRNGFVGLLLGGLLGSFVKDPNGKVLWDMGATGGFATISLITTVAVPKSRPMGPSITLGMLNGFTTSYAAAKLYIQLSNKPAEPKPPAEITKITWITAAAGTVLGCTIGAIAARPGKTNSISRFLKKSKIFSNTAFTFNANRLGIVMRF